jgi:transcriptional regulator with XRE-family HTH domain
MSTERKHDFVIWLDEILTERNWSDNELAKRAGLSHSSISKARSGILPQWEACKAIAHALGVNPILVFRKAGLLPPGPADDVRFEDWKELIPQLDPRDEAFLKQTAQHMIETNQKERGLKSLKPKTN